MDKKVVVMASALLVLAMTAAACGGDDEEEAKPTVTTRPAPTATATPTQRAATPTPTSPPATATPTPTEAAVEPVALGKSLSARNGCTACHSIDGSATIGPTWKGLYGKEQTLVDGSKVIVDDAYLHESIVDPDAKIVKGFSAGIMPVDFGDKLSEDQLRAIIAHIKALK